ncbi:MAG: cell division protein ZapA [Candidatus Dependentiae bacterium]|jgi:cell division protein ZapA (FtsZ GTPase activity inhibitor)
MADTITITVRGKTYRISTQEPAAYVHEAAQLLEGATAEIATKVPAARDEQLMLFASLQTLVGLIKSREEKASELTAHTERLNTALAAAE